MRARSHTLTTPSDPISLLLFSAAENRSPAHFLLHLPPIREVVGSCRYAPFRHTGPGKSGAFGSVRPGRKPGIAPKRAWLAVPRAWPPPLPQLPAGTPRSIRALGHLCKRPFVRISGGPDPSKGKGRQNLLCSAQVREHAELQFYEIAACS